MDTDIASWTTHIGNLGKYTWFQFVINTILSIFCGTISLTYKRGFPILTSNEKSSYQNWSLKENSLTGGTHMRRINQKQNKQHLLIKNITLLLLLLLIVLAGSSRANANPCADNCNNHGVCTNGKCYCQPGWSGDTCQNQANANPCADNCSNHGVCKNGKCYCHPGFTGQNCEQQLACPNNCSGRGTCQAGKWFCLPEWTGSSCEIKKGTSTLHLTPPPADKNGL